MDKLEAILKAQKVLEDAVGAEIFQRNPLRGNSQMKEYPNQMFILLSFVGIITEACEALENTPWKPWKDSMRFDREAFKRELIDLLHFVFNLCLAADMDAEDIYNLYIEKHKINMKRQKEKY